MTNIDMVSERQLADAELELVAGGGRGIETNNTNLNSECGAGRNKGPVICAPNNSDGFIGETFSNKA